ncbi:MAG: hypothetical protein J6N95_03560 [Bacilli bacterium]|nr:hypothetical protein [Bacilli bacterium]
METNAKVPVMIELAKLRKGKPVKRVFLAKVSHIGVDYEFILETTKTKLCTLRFRIAPGDKVTCGEQSYLITMMSIYWSGPPDFFAKPIETSQSDIEELRIYAKKEFGI